MTNTTIYLCNFIEVSFQSRHFTGKYVRSVSIDPKLRRRFLRWESEQIKRTIITVTTISVAVKMKGERIKETKKEGITARMRGCACVSRYSSGRLATTETVLSRWCGVSKHCVDRRIDKIN